MASSSTGGFKSFIENVGLIDMGFKGVDYTWNNKRAGKENIQERLDRALINGEWRTRFPNAFISHLTGLNCDHRPLLLDTNLKNTPTAKPFRFETMWTRDPTTGEIIAKAWRRSFPANPIQGLKAKLRQTKIALKIWNKSTFGNLQSNIKALRNIIEALQSLPYTLDTQAKEMSAQHTLEEMLKREELHWRDKSKLNWMAGGDANTRYFHISTLIKRRFNAIEFLFLPNGNRTRVDI